MQALEYIRIVRRRWYYIVLGLLVGVAAGWVTAPGTGARPVRFSATTTLLLQSGPSGIVNLDQAALLVTTGDVPDRAAAKLAGDRSRNTLVVMVRATVDFATSSLTIAATSDTPADAEQVSAAFTDALLESYVDDDLATYEAGLAQVQQRIDAARAELADLANQINALPESDPTVSDLEAAQQATQSRLATLVDQQRQLVDLGPPTAPLEVVERGQGRRVTEKGVRAPDSKVGRGAMLGVFGLLLGLGGAVASVRLDTRVRGKDDAEAAFGAPVIAEIPPLPGGNKNRRELFSQTRPAAPIVEAYRALRTVVLYAAATAHRAEGETNGHNPARKLGAAQHADHDSQVVLVTSPAAGEGKTTTAAHLAALLAEVGKSVLVVSADFRRPRIHELFGVEREPGLADVLTGATDRSLSSLNLETNVPGVRLLPSGSPVTNPAPFLLETAQLVAAAREIFDYVIVDTAPLLVANDATELAGVADMVIVLARADRTTRDAAQRAAEVLERVEAPVLGVVVIGANDTPTAYKYYRYRYYSDVAEQPEGKRRGRRRARAEEAKAVEPVTAGELSD